jgi:hypothetical protein
MCALQASSAWILVGATDAVIDLLNMGAEKAVVPLDSFDPVLFEEV